MAGDAAAVDHADDGDDFVDDVDVVAWGENVRSWRVERGLNGIQFAFRLSRFLGRRVPQSRVSEWEQGRSRPNDQMRIAIARVLAVPVGDLFPYPPDVMGGGGGGAAGSRLTKGGGAS